MDRPDLLVLIAVLYLNIALLWAYILLNLLNGSK